LQAAGGEQIGRDAALMCSAGTPKLAAICGNDVIQDRAVQVLHEERRRHDQRHAPRTPATRMVEKLHLRIIIHQAVLCENGTDVSGSPWLKI